MDYDIVVIGAGIVGLSAVFQIQKKQLSKKILMIEKEFAIAQHQSGNNSGVIHSGVFYPPNSFKAKNCIEGREFLIDFCKQYGISFDMCGKLILATQSKQLPILQDIYQRGIENKLKGIRWVKEEEIIQYEPYARGKAAIWVPQAGIVDYKKISKKLMELVTNQGAEIYFNSQVVKLEKRNDGVIVHMKKKTVHTKQLINCAGLYTDKIAQMTSEKKLDFQTIPFRGEYYKLKKEKHFLIRNLIYPVPDPRFPFLGVHFTPTIDGEIKVGPNAVLSYSREGYKKTDISLSELKEILLWPGFQKIIKKYWFIGLHEFLRSYLKSLFVKSLAELVPSITANDIVKAGSGVRAQMCTRDGDLINDFVYLQQKNIIHICNAPSPAATSCLAVGKRIAHLVENEK